MITIKCELCGSNNLKKVDGEYECQYCGTKYTTEEAKKLVVEIEGTVKIDMSSQKDNLEKLAKRAYEDKLYEQAYEYYSKLLELDCDNYTYIYKRGICAAWKSTLADFRIDEAVKACKGALKVIKQEEIKVNNIENLYYNMATEINNVITAFYFQANHHYEKFWTLQSSASEYWNRVITCINCEEYAKELVVGCYKNNERIKNTYIAILENIVAFCVEVCKPRRYKAGTSQYGDVYKYNNCSENTRKALIEKYNCYVKVLKELNPKYLPKKINGKAKIKWF